MKLGFGMLRKGFYDLGIPLDDLREITGNAHGI